MKQPIWYRKVEAFLEPYRWLVTLLIVAIIVISLKMLFTKSNTARAAWVTYMFMP